MLPREFEQRMRKILGDETDSFLDALDRPAIRSYRTNPIKMGDSDFILGDSAVTDIPFCKGAHALTEGCEGLGNTPEHHSGMIYIQDAGAMGPVCALPRLPDGARVLDLCAAPGGKSSQIAAMIGGGSLLSNELVPKRARILVSNLERLGVTNAAVTSLDSAALADLYPCYFDAVVVDAPCSGEGMFRKGDEALLNWSLENVNACQVRQGEILNNAKRCVAGGGYLLYSTCTYSPEENELTVSDFLDDNPDFHLVECENEALISATRAGISFVGARYDMSLCRRSYPHASLGEGQFFALMKREGGSRTEAVKDGSVPLTKAESATVLDFLRENLTEIPKGRLLRQGSTVSLAMHSLALPKNGVFMAGVAIGELVKGRVVPHHQLFSALGHLFKNRRELKSYDEARRYMHGEEIASDGLTGFVCVSWAGASLGGGKASGGVIKNYYPKGLRI